MNSYNYSFIIPHRNSLELLKRCVSSIPKRNDVQIIIVDDNSDEELKPIIQGDNMVIRYLNEREAKRAGHARNIGINIASGKWLLFADADDYYSENLLNVLDKYKDLSIDVLYFNYYRIYANGNCVSNSALKDNPSNNENMDVIKYKLKMPWNKMVRRKFIIDNRIHFEEVINGNDMFFSFQVGYWSENVEFVNTPLYYYEVSTVGSMTNTKRYGDDYYLCRLNHWFQTNEFYRFINHQNWTYFLPFRFLAILKRKGFMEFIKCIRVFLLNYRSISKEKLKFVNYIKQQKAKKSNSKH